MGNICYYCDMTLEMHYEGFNKKQVYQARYPIHNVGGTVVLGSRCPTVRDVGPHPQQY
jgi:hypothetical protein